MSTGIHIACISILRGRADIRELTAVIIRGQSAGIRIIAVAVAGRMWSEICVCGHFADQCSYFVGALWTSDGESARKQESINRNNRNTFPID